MAMPEIKKDLNLGLRNASRYICSHDSSGKGVFLDSPDLQYFDAGGAYASARSYALSQVPAPLANDVDVKGYLSEDGEKSITSYRNNAITIDGGVNMVCVNFAPGKDTTMHRTTSIDFAIIVEGEIELELDSGEKKQLRSGDTIIQRATMHKWRNMSETKPARLIAVTIDSERFDVAGKPIALEFH